jgi:soluble cytochrome b562
MRIWGTILMVVVAMASTSVASSKASVDELKARLQNARPDERAGISLEIAERQVDTADKLYKDGKVDEAQAAIKDVVSYAGQAGDATAQSGHHIKNTEIAMRKMAHKLNDVKRTVSYENQPTLQSAIDSLEKIRTDLLNKMFGKNAK